LHMGDISEWIGSLWNEAVVYGLNHTFIYRLNIMQEGTLLPELHRKQKRYVK